MNCKDFCDYCDESEGSIKKANIYKYREEYAVVW
jgi:hypothetical protein